MTVLVTGTASGLGLAMCKTLDGEAFVRGSAPREPSYEAIVHCAFNSAKDVPIEAAPAYIDDNVLLTERLLALPHRRFVYISSVDVHKPTETMGLYAASKLICEILVARRASRPLIVRPTTLLGLPMRPNSIYRLLTEPQCRLHVSYNSRYNVVLHRDLCEFVRRGLAEDKEGTVEFAAAQSFIVGEVAYRLGLAPCFGSYEYGVEARWADSPGLLQRSSWENLCAFIALLGSRYIGRPP